MAPASSPPTSGNHRRRTLVVTGSASGIGAALRERLERSGARVIGVDQRDADVTVDLARPDGRQRAVDEVAASCGGKLDGAVACAGLGPQVRPTDRICSVNFFGALAVLDGLLPVLATGEAPSAVAISSNAASLMPPNAPLLARLLEADEAGATQCAATLDGATVYGTAKLALTRAVRRRAGPWAAHGVRLNAVAPGPVDTPLLAGGLEDPVLAPLIEALPVPLGRRATADEIAGAVAFLLDPTHGYVHGSVLFVDGGSDALLRPDAL